MLLGEVDPAVAQFPVVQAGLLGPLPGQLLDAGQILALLLALEDPLQQRLCGLRVAVEVVGQFDLQEVVDKGAHARTAGTDLRAAELGFRLGFEHGLLHANCNACHEAHADVAGIVFLLVEVANDLDEGLTQGLLVGSALGGVLAVDEAVVVLPVGLGVGQGHLDVVSPKVDDGVARLGAQVLFDEVLQAILTVDFLAIEDEGQSAVEVGVIPQQALDVLTAVLVALEDGGVRLEPGACAVAERGLGNGLVVLQDAQLEPGSLDLPSRKLSMRIRWRGR